MKEISGDEIKVSASYSEKVQINKFEPIEVSCSESRTVKSIKEGEKVWEEIFNICKARVKKQIKIEQDAVAEAKPIYHRILDVKNVKQSESEKDLDFRPEEHVDEPTEEGINDL